MEIAAENVANLTTPGYKRRVPFAELLPDNRAETRLGAFIDASAGKPVNSGNPTDFFIAGPGYFPVSDGQRTLFTRQGQFVRAADGRLLTAQGYALQSADGGDLVLKPGGFELAADGVVTQGAVAVGRIVPVDFPAAARLEEAGGMIAAGDAEPAPSAAQLRQGAYEASNVSTGEEMVTMMEALRRAEGAQRLINVYDDLMGRALAAFGGQG